MVHRDIKPGNFLLGKGENAREIYIIDYGLCKRYIDGRSRQHIYCETNVPLAGTVRFSSINAHMGYEQSRRDDLEGLAYSLIYLAKGILPWQGIVRETKKEKIEGIMEKKMEISAELLCSELPPEFGLFLRYCRDLKFEQKPNYKLLRNLLGECFKKNIGKESFQYDWEKIKYEPGKFLLKPVNTNDSNQVEGVTKDDGLQRDKSPDLNMMNRGRFSEAQLHFRVGAIKQLLGGITTGLSSGNIKVGATQKEALAQNIEKAAHNRMSNQEAKLEEEKKHLRVERTTIRSKSQDIAQIEAASKEAINKSCFNEKQSKEDPELCNFTVADLMEDPSLLDDTIPCERPTHNTRILPQSNYVKNSAHWENNRRKAYPKAKTMVRFIKKDKAPKEKTPKNSESQNRSLTFMKFKI